MCAQWLVCLPSNLVTPAKTRMEAHTYMPAIFQQKADWQIKACLGNLICPREKELTCICLVCCANMYLKKNRVVVCLEWEGPYKTDAYLKSSSQIASDEPNFMQMSCRPNWSWNSLFFGQFFLFSQNIAFVITTFSF